MSKTTAIEWLLIIMVYVREKILPLSSVALSILSLLNDVLFLHPNKLLASTPADPWHRFNSRCHGTSLIV